MKVNIRFRAALFLCLWQFSSQSAGQSCPLLNGPSLRPRPVVWAPERLALETGDLASLRERSDYNGESGSGIQDQKS